MLIRIQNGEYELRFEAQADGTWRRLEWNGSDPVKMTLVTRNAMLKEFLEVASTQTAEWMRMRAEDRKEALENPTKEIKTNGHREQGAG